MTHQRATQKVYLHPFLVRLTHWLNAIALTVMVLSGLRIFWAYQGFNLNTRVNPAQVHETPAVLDFSEGFRVNPRASTDIFIPVRLPSEVYEGVTLGGWLGGALRWHFTFMWLYVLGGMLYLGYSLLSGNYRTVIFRPRDLAGVWPMAAYYLRLRQAPPVYDKYNPLQRLAYTLVVLAGVGSVLTGIALYKPVQVEWLTRFFGGYQTTRLWHFLLVWVFLGFVIGHVAMVVLHGWNNFASMLTGWKRLSHSEALAMAAAGATGGGTLAAETAQDAQVSQQRIPRTTQEDSTHGN